LLDLALGGPPPRSARTELLLACRSLDLIDAPTIDQVTRSEIVALAWVLR
jgi:hypothetical protein